MVIFSRTYEVIRDAKTTLNGHVVTPQEKVWNDKILCKPQQIFRNLYSSIIEPMSGVDDFTKVSQKHENEGVD